MADYGGVVGLNGACEVSASWQRLPFALGLV